MVVARAAQEQVAAAAALDEVATVLALDAVAASPSVEALGRRAYLRAGVVAPAQSATNSVTVASIVVIRLIYPPSRPTLAAALPGSV